MHTFEGQGVAWNLPAVSLGLNKCVEPSIISVAGVNKGEAPFVSLGVRKCAERIAFIT